MTAICGRISLPRRIAERRFGSCGTGVVDPGFPPYGGWEHFAINFDTISDIGTIYRNGVQVMSGFYGDNSPVQSLTIGHHGNLANHADTLSGLLDDLRVDDRLLSASEIPSAGRDGQSATAAPRLDSSLDV